jgi:hypothetical protein
MLELKRPLTRKKQRRRRNGGRSNAKIANLYLQSKWWPLGGWQLSDWNFCFSVPLCGLSTEEEMEDEEAADADADADGNEEITTYTHVDKSKNSYAMTH